MSVTYRGIISKVKKSKKKKEEITEFSRQQNSLICETNVEMAKIYCNLIKENFKDIQCINLNVTNFKFIYARQHRSSAEDFLSMCDQ